jgi:hypothetical protein
MLKSVSTSDTHSINATNDSHFDRCIGKINEYRGHGRISGELESDQTLDRFKLGATTRENNSAYKKYSRIDNT